MKWPSKGPGVNPVVSPLFLICA
ncbi:rCG41188 [Rattus norvegicus]|uniref:RCG41188 n=1 Tax=Rattus norvegicus TaxID=10116 RepID=A6KMV2_RAT|nr:rCG41188 [Rattus norvegicus]